MEIIYTVSTQFVVEVDENLTKEDILEMSEEEIINVMTDITYQSEGELGEVTNVHGKAQFELLDDDDKSIRYFESYGDD